MKNRTIIKKILKEEVHPDYEWLDEGAVQLGLTLGELKILMLTLKVMGAKIGLNNRNNHIFIRTLEKLMGVRDGAIKTKMVLIAFFNSITDLEIALLNKDTKQLYDGPFYITKLGFWEEDGQSKQDEREIDCEECSGGGEIVNDEDETEECYYCDGRGEEIGYIDVYETTKYEIQLFSQQPIDSDEHLIDDLLSDDGVILRGSRNWVDSTYDEESRGEGSIIDVEITDQDIIVKGVNIINLFD